MSGNSPITKKLHKKKNGEWSETCYGWWSRRMIDISNGKSANNKTSKNSTWNSSPVCTGVNVIRIRDLEVESVEPTHTHGLQVVITEKTGQPQPTDFPVNPSDDIFTSALRLYKKSEGVNELFKEGAENLKNGTQTMSDMLKDWKSSDAPMIKRAVYREYEQFRKWLESFWK